MTVEEATQRLHEAREIEAQAVRDLRAAEDNHRKASDLTRRAWEALQDAQREARRTPVPEEPVQVKIDWNQLTKGAK